MLKAAVSRYIGRRWSKAGPTRNWWTSAVLRDHIAREISGFGPGGVAGALLEATGGKALERGISIGCGNGSKELGLMERGCVQRFELYELAEVPAEQARQSAAQRGLADRVRVHIADAFTTERPGTYDLVYWDHSLHHMFDVDKALRFSVNLLRPGGWLAVNDYAGPTRLQVTRAEADLANEFLDRERSVMSPNLRRARPGSPFGRLRVYLRDPSEAPQSDRIDAAFERNTGTSTRHLGGAMIHILAPQVIEASARDPGVLDRLIAWDQTARARGLNHFSFGLWQKPALQS